MRRLVPVVLALAGLGAGVGAGVVLQPEPAPETPATPCGETPVTDTAPPAKPSDHSRAETAELDYVKLNNQFVVPVVRDGRVGALVVLSFGLEVPPGAGEAVYRREPKLRDAFLQVLFDHANAGGFDGRFTDSSQMDALRRALLEVAQKLVGPGVTDVLIMDIVRQDT